MKTNLSDSEWTLMNCLWEKHPMTITELTAALRPKTGWGEEYHYHDACPAGGQGRSLPHLRGAGQAVRAPSGPPGRGPGGDKELFGEGLRLSLIHI